jgi:hypothetical protein
MPILSMPPKSILRDWKLYCLEQLAYHDVASVFPTPPPEMLEKRANLIEQLQEVDRRFDVLGADEEERDVTWMAEGFWDAADASEEE